MADTDAAFRRLEAQVRDANSTLYTGPGIGKYFTAVGEYDGTDVKPTLTAIKGESEDDAKKRIALERKARAEGRRVHTLSDAVRANSTSVDFRFRQQPTTQEPFRDLAVSPPPPPKVPFMSGAGHSMAPTAPSSTESATNAAETTDAPDRRRARMAEACEKRLQKTSAMVHKK